MDGHGFGRIKLSRLAHDRAVSSGGVLAFTQDLTDGGTYSLSNFSLGDPMPYAQILQQNTLCFCAGTWIDTPSGAKRVETLHVGDLVNTRHHGAQTIR